MIFEKGAHYSITMDEGGSIGTAVYKIEEIDGSLIKVSAKYMPSHRIINAASPAFHYADVIEGMDESTEDLDVIVLNMDPDDLKL